MKGRLNIPVLGHLISFTNQGELLNLSMPYFTKEIHLNDLLKERDCTFEIEVEIIATKCCDKCLMEDGKILDLEVAIELQPLPNTKCTRIKGCVCCYGFKGKLNEKGRLIMKNFD